mgnify:CR=1 FL=1
MILGALRAGVIGYYFPSSVIKGMLSGIGIIIFLKQSKYDSGHRSYNFIVIILISVLDIVITLMLNYTQSQIIKAIILL